MTPPNHCIGPTWPPHLEVYDYLSRLDWRDWAWEGLRRNQTYQAEAQARASVGNVSKQLEGGALLTQMQEPVLPAEAWALCSFRQPRPYRFASASRVAAGGRSVYILRRGRAG